MDIGIFVPPLADTWQLVKRAEELGYKRAPPAGEGTGGGRRSVKQ